MKISNPLRDALLAKEIELPNLLSDPSNVVFLDTESHQDQDDIIKLFPHIHSQSYLRLAKGNAQHPAIKVGVVFSGGQAPGGHNVLIGLQDTLTRLNPDSCLIGFLNGPSGLIKNHFMELTKKTLQPFKNLGGFHCIGSGRTKIEKKEQLEKALATAKEHKLDAFIIIGGDDSNTNAAVLAEYFKAHNQPTAVIGVPKTIDGDLKNKYVEVSFGFDTASKVYSELIGNISIDAKSGQKYYHFIKIMGRSASHVALDCALRTSPNLLFIGEEIKENKSSLSHLIEEITNLILERAKENKNYGIILIPEGLVDFIPEFKNLNEEINQLLAKDSSYDDVKIAEGLSEKNKDFYTSLPLFIQKQLLLERDPHGNIQVAKIDIQSLLLEMTRKDLKEKNFEGSFHAQSHYLGYEGRCAHPSPFDAQYTYCLGSAAALLASQKKTGYMACVKNLKEEVSQWEIFGLPITSLLHLEIRHGEKKPVIQKALVNLNSKPFLTYKKLKNSWRIDDHYNSPGPIQYFGDPKITDIRNSLVDTA